MKSCLLARRSGCPLLVGRDRVAAGRALLAAHPEVNVLLCDDGLQHYRLARDVEIAVFDARGAGNGWRLPWGRCVSHWRVWRRWMRWSAMAVRWMRWRWGVRRLR